MRRLFTITALLLAASAGTAQARVAAPDVPTPIQVTGDFKPYLLGHAVGVQIYKCNDGGWSLVAPRADLYDDHGNLLATHYGGPTWEARDGSWVKAGRVDGVTVDGSAIQWLLLARTSSGPGPDGGRLAGTTHIQRVATTGGLAPAACTAEEQGTLKEVPYTADYYFWKGRSS